MSRLFVQPGSRWRGASAFGATRRCVRSGVISTTYSSYARGTDPLVGTYNYLDLVPKGRDEDQLDFTMSWVRHHDRYDDGYLADDDRPYWPDAAAQNSK